MTQFVAFDPRVENLGAGVVSLRHAAGESIRPILEKHGLIDVDPDAWYPHQPLLNVYREISETGGFDGMMNLVSIGMRIPDDAKFPPGINDIPSALHSLDMAYKMNHRGGEIGYYHAVELAYHHMVVECCNPYPSDFDYGLIYSLVRRFRGNGINFTVTRDEQAPSRLKGDDVCIYHVSWG